MPKPKPGESRSDYMDRCIPYVLKEKGITQEQAAGMCGGMFDDMHKNEYTQLVVNLDFGHVREEQLLGEKHWVVPMAMMTVGVHEGSRGKLLYDEPDLSAACPAWNHKPIVINHPVKGTACTQQYLNENQVGVVLNTKFDGKQRAEAWLNQKRVTSREPRIEESIKKKHIMEVSTGLFLDPIFQPGKFKDKEYEYVAKNHRPDHLAILPDSVGACSVADGAGLFQLNEKAKQIAHNELSFGQISEELYESLREKYQTTDSRNVGMMFMPAPCYIKDVFPTYFIYCYDDSDYKQSYHVDADDAVTLVGDPQEVEMVTSYEPVDNQQVTPPLERIDVMAKAKKELIDSIISNKESGFTEDNRKHLEAFNETQLEKLLPGVKKAAVSFETQEEFDKKVEELISKKIPNNNQQKPPEPPAKPKTVNEFLSDPNLPQEVRNVLSQGVSLYQQDIDRLVTVITANKANVFTAEQLKTMDVNQLRGLAALAASGTEQTTQTGVVSYFGGQGAPVGNAAPMKEELPLPTYNFKKEAAKA
jgi:hypothetical protein